MKATLISTNDKRKTAMLIIKYDDDGWKRSATRHCLLSPGGTWRGYVLDADRRELESMAQAGGTLATTIDAMNRELGTKAPKTSAYTPTLLFAWTAGADNTDAYHAHMSQERQNARQSIARLFDEAERLRVLVDVRRAEQQRKKAVAVAQFANLMTAGVLAPG